MDQPYSRIADALLDYQYWSAERSAEDAVRRHRLDVPRRLSPCRRCASTDVKVLDAPMERVKGDVKAPGGVDRHRHASSSINHNADNALVTLRYKFKDATFEAAEEPFDAAGKKFNRGSFVIRNVAAGRSRQGRRPSSA